MPTYIDVEPLRDHWLYDTVGNEPEFCPNDVLDSIDNTPIADVAPIIHAHWWLEKNPNGTPYCFHCSNCDEDGSIISNTTASNYCPDCGAKMDKGIDYKSNKAFNRESKKVGYWKNVWLNSSTNCHATCSVCRKEAVKYIEDYYDAITFDYCPNCGAKMEREDIKG